MMKAKMIETIKNKVSKARNVYEWSLIENGPNSEETVYAHVRWVHYAAIASSLDIYVD